MSMCTKPKTLLATAAVVLVSCGHAANADPTVLAFADLDAVTAGASSRGTAHASARAPYTQTAARTATIAAGAPLASAAAVAVAAAGAAANPVGPAGVTATVSYGVDGRPTMKVSRSSRGSGLSAVLVSGFSAQLRVY